MNTKKYYEKWFCLFEKMWFHLQLFLQKYKMHRETEVVKYELWNQFQLNLP